jgi:uncharacterized membrane protein YedE/YeeE
MWNLFFVGGIFLGGLACSIWFTDDNPIVVHEALQSDLAAIGVTDYHGLMPKELFSWEALTTTRGWVLMVFGGLLVGFGTRYAGGCTSGHAIMGLSTLQLPSLIATCCFMIGGLLMTHFILPFILML